jgi:hypothetical protein
MTCTRTLLAALTLVGLAGETQAKSADELAKKLSNPISSLISVPLQYNYNDGIGDGNGEQSYINIQPVIPFSIGENWNLISRTILPVVNQGNFFPGDEYKTGLGNITQSFFFSPKEPTKGGLIWGVGPVLQIPTVTNDIAPDQWGAGVTGVVLKQGNGWTVGALANHVWSISDEDEFGETSTTFLQPFVSYTTKKATSYSINTEAQYDWIAEEWSVPINLTVGQIIKAGGKPLQLTGGVRYWADSPPGGPEGWGARLVVTFLFPKS